MNINFSGGLLIAKRSDSTNWTDSYWQMQQIAADLRTGGYSALQFSHRYQGEDIFMIATAGEADDLNELQDQFFQTTETLSENEEKKATDDYLTKVKEIHNDTVEKALAGETDLPDEVLKQLSVEVQAYLPAEVKERLNMEG